MCFLRLENPLIENLGNFHYCYLFSNIILIFLTPLSHQKVMLGGIVFAKLRNVFEHGRACGGFTLAPLFEMTWI